MDEINNNLLKLRSEVMQINDTFKKETTAKNDVVKDYMKFLNVSLIRITVLFVIFCLVLYVSKPDFCHVEIVNEGTFFKEKKISEYRIAGISAVFTALIFYFTQSITF